MKKQSSWIEDKYDKLIEKATSPERIDFILSQQLRMDGVRPGSVTYDLIKRKADERKNKLKGGAIMNKQMIRKLASLADKLDKKGAYKEAEYIDGIIKMAAGAQEQLAMYSKKYEDLYAANKIWQQKPGGGRQYTPEAQDVIANIQKLKQQVSQEQQGAVAGQDLKKQYVFYSNEYDKLKARDAIWEPKSGGGRQYTQVAQKVIAKIQVLQSQMRQPVAAK